MKQKKLLVLASIILLMIGILTGCQNSSEESASKSDKLTMEEATKVNKASYLLEHYNSVSYSQLDYVGGNTIHITYFKDDKGNICATADDSGYKGYMTDAFSFSREKGESTYTLYATKEVNVSDYLFMVSGSEFTSQSIDKTGNIVCETEAEIDQEFADNLFETWPVTIEDKMITTTTFAPDDFRVLSVDFSIRRPDKSELKIASGVLLYDQEIQHADAVKGYLDAEKFTISINMEDGNLRTAEVPKGEVYKWECDEGYALYLDDKGTIPLLETSNPVQSNMTLYCLQKK